MVALATDKLLKVGNPGSATTLSSPGYTVGATSITVGSTSNWPTDTGVAFAIDEAEVVNGVEVQVAGTYNEYVGTVASGTSITNVAWVLGSGDRNYASGALTRVYIPVSAERENRIVEWGTAQHNQDGTHAVVTATSVATSGSVTAGNGLTVTGGAVSLPAGSLETADYATSSVTSPKVDWTTVGMIGYSEDTAAVGSIFAGGTQVLATGVIVIPAGVTRVLVEATVGAISKNANGALTIEIFDSGVSAAKSEVSAAVGAVIALSVRRRIAVIPGSSHNFTCNVYPNADTATVSSGSMRTITVTPC